MTDDRRHTETEVESRAMLAALYRVLEDARRYEEYAEVAQWAYDEELLDFFRELQEESRGRAGQAEKLLAQRLADGGVHEPTHPTLCRPSTILREKFVWVTV